jgi:hypothetical protein
LKNEEENRPDFNVQMDFPLSPNDGGLIPLNRKRPMVRGTTGEYDPLGTNATLQSWFLQAECKIPK